MSHLLLERWGKLGFAPSPAIAKAIPATHSDAGFGRFARRGIVYRAELERVRQFGHEKPEDHVVWVSKSQPAADHDIRSIDKDGKPLWLEVKSTMGADGRFEWPQREFEKALRERGRYILWRVYEAHTTRPTAKEFADPAGLLERSKLRVELSGMVDFVEPK